MLTGLDYVVLVVYLVGVLGFGLWAGGRQQTTTDYFLGGRDLPWWAVLFSIVATETSTLTVIGVPAVAYGGSLLFLQLTFGFLLGRIAVAVLLLPRYFDGEQVTAYAFLGARFGPRMQVAASLTFMGTRLLADGVRLFATAIPLKVIAAAAGLEVSYAAIIVAIGLVTVAYTFVGGIKAVVWMDVVQMGVYVGGALLAVGLLLGDVPGDWWATARAAGKTQIIDLGFDLPFDEWVATPYTLVVAVLGGAFFSAASHGADQLVVQRLLACRSLRDGQRALVGSGIAVVGQFALFLLVGLLLWSYYGGADLADLGLSRGDEVFPKFIVEAMPAGLAGLLLAGIVAAAMSTLSSSLNALASSTVLDLRGARRTPRSEEDDLRLSRWATLGWGVGLMGFAALFESMTDPVVELGLGIASFTYGGLLGAFLLGLVSRRAQQREALVAYAVTLVALGVGVQTGGLAWPLYTAAGAGLTVALGTLLGLRHR
ncbi:MAG: sodium:solute symporter [Bacteroidota bacterium]